jgi:hypothetical protein
MDPNANLKEQLALAQDLLDRIDEHGYDYPALSDGNVECLCELVLALNNWIAGGGFLPSRWQKKE